ncbi:hypothetical protein [Desulfosporosinus fructosivorans]
MGVKYCGHCNPEVEGPELVVQILALAPEITAVTWEEDMDILLVISSCAFDCVSHPVFQGPVVNVAGRFVERVVHPLQDLPSAILVKIREKVTALQSELNRGNSTLLD